MPWIGWFDLIDQADTVIILDDVAFSKQSWQQRNRIRTPDGLQYLTLPVATSGMMGQLISEAKISETHFLKKMLKTIKQNYSNANFFNLYYESFCEKLTLAMNSNKLVDINIEIIYWFLENLGIDKKLLLASDLNTTGNKSQHVLNLCKKVEASHYLSPHGAFEYLNKDRGLFAEADMEIEFHNFLHPVYKQCFSPFLPYASTLDLLMNVGSDSMSVIKSGRRDSFPLS